MVHSGVGFSTVKYPAEEKGRGKSFHTGQCLSIRPQSGWVGHITGLSWSGTKLWDSCACLHEDQQAPRYPTPSILSFVKPSALFFSSVRGFYTSFLHLPPNSHFPIHCCSSVSSSLTSVLNYWDRLKQLLSALRQSWERQKRKKETEEREIWWAGSSMFKEGVLSGASGRMSGVPTVYIREISLSVEVSLCTRRCPIFKCIRA